MEYLSLKFIFICVYVCGCVFVCMCMHMCVVCVLHVYVYLLGRQKSTLYVSQLMWVLGMEVLSSERALSIPSPWEIAPVLLYLYLTFIINEFTKYIQNMVCFRNDLSEIKW